MLSDEAFDFLQQGAPLPWRVPAFKFESKHAWYVTLDECRWIAHALRHIPDIRAHRLYRFCLLAARHYGFLVQ
jgi:hypothetical protein